MMNPTLLHDNRAIGLQDGLKSRLMVGFVASVVLNLMLWRAAAAIAKHPPVFTPRPVEITRVIIDNKGHKQEKIVTKKDIQKKVEKVRKPIPIPKPLPRPITPKPPTPHVTKIEPPKPAAPPPPETAHNKILTALPDKNAAPKPDDHTALPNGNGALGKPTDQQGTGNAMVNPPVTPKVEPKAVTKVDPPKVETKVEPAPVKVDPPKVEPVAPPVEPVQPVVPKHKGPTRDAQPDNQTNPEIPDDLKHGNFKSFVRVKVEIDEDGNFTPILRTSSGNADIDSRVLEALKKWKWKPALKDGVPVKSVQLFKFEFEVQ
jgi:TonB family protein